MFAQKFFEFRQYAIHIGAQIADAMMQLKLVISVLHAYIKKSDTCFHLFRERHCLRAHNILKNRA
ncbi:hypothetical protein D5041_10435 [Verminephrobacter aporrectodeae subsp. tuberculatae]|nr:hypothetical protein [Verminephrobacter aporrectodeae subsp. tuberculatae]MCW5289460.1 hypothetical protein [Verminephrobacter aporrectodeae subsp. tuberculatae]MCW8167047.1 hypothetical protein [Verminephrobacter aporrectodeae subsp. tuberculatae]MCW8169685.1 hypothetical protein [Verminephrobacter aporrectodeae subsp. tuberculatae]MCW8209487.1 hypothetical protein [Verminephrobacter aporrectodeae subsp. tuberculatae]